MDATAETDVQQWWRGAESMRLVPLDRPLTVFRDPWPTCTYNPAQTPRGAADREDDLGVLRVTDWLNDIAARRPNATFHDVPEGLTQQKRELREKNRRTRHAQKRKRPPESVGTRNKVLLDESGKAVADYEELFGIQKDVIKYMLPRRKKAVDYKQFLDGEMVVREYADVEKEKWEQHKLMEEQRKRDVQMLYGDPNDKRKDKLAESLIIEVVQDLPETEQPAPQQKPEECPDPVPKKEPVCEMVSMSDYESESGLESESEEGMAPPQKKTYRLKQRLTNEEEYLAVRNQPIALCSQKNMKHWDRIIQEEKFRELRDAQVYKRNNYEFWDEYVADIVQRKGSLRAEARETFQKTTRTNFVYIPGTSNCGVNVENIKTLTEEQKFCVSTCGITATLVSPLNTDCDVLNKLAERGCTTVRVPFLAPQGTKSTNWLEKLVPMVGDVTYFEAEGNFCVAPTLDLFENIGYKSIVFEDMFYEVQDRGMVVDGSGNNRLVFSIFSTIPEVPLWVDASVVPEVLWAQYIPIESTCVNVPANPTLNCRLPTRKRLNTKLKERKGGPRYMPYQLRLNILDSLKEPEDFTVDDCLNVVVLVKKMLPRNANRVWPGQRPRISELLEDPSEDLD